MAFGGIGDVGQLVGIDGGVVLVNELGAYALNPPGAYVQFGANGTASGRPLGLPNDADRFWAKRVQEERGALQSILIRAVGGGEDPDELLEDCSGQDVAEGTTPDVGILSTAEPDGLTPITVPAGGRHFLPANFGKGRNNWIIDDIVKFRVEFWVPAVCQDADGLVAMPVIYEMRFVQFGSTVDANGRPLGNIEIVIANLGLAILDSGAAIVVHVLHSTGW